MEQKVTGASGGDVFWGLKRWMDGWMDGSDHLCWFFLFAVLLDWFCTGPKIDGQVWSGKQGWR